MPDESAVALVKLSRAVAPWHANDTVLVPIAVAKMLVRSCDAESFVPYPPISSEARVRKRSGLEIV